MYYVYIMACSPCFRCLRCTISKHVPISDRFFIVLLQAPTSVQNKKVFFWQDDFPCGILCLLFLSVLAILRKLRIGTVLNILLNFFILVLSEHEMALFLIGSAVAIQVHQGCKKRYVGFLRILHILGLENSVDPR